MLLIRASVSSTASVHAGDIIARDCDLRASTLSAGKKGLTCVAHGLKSSPPSSICFLTLLEGSCGVSGSQLEAQGP